MKLNEIDLNQKLPSKQPTNVDYARLNWKAMYWAQALLNWGKKNNITKDDWYVEEPRPREEGTTIVFTYFKDGHDDNLSKVYRDYDLYCEDLIEFMEQHNKIDKQTYDQFLQFIRYKSRKY